MSSGRVALLAVVACSACERGAGKSLAPATAPPARGAPSARADSLYHSGSFEEARRLWTIQLDSAWGRGDSAEAARLLTALGLTARQLGDYDGARRLLEHSLDLKRRLDMRHDLFRSHNALGLLAWTRGDLSAATRHFDDAAAAALAVDDSLGAAKAAGNMAQVHHDRGEPFLARDGFGRLADMSRAAGDTVALARTLINLAMLEIRLGDPLSAVARLGEARQLGRATGDAEAEENALGQLATAHAAMGRPQEALATLDTALVLAQRHGLRRQVAEDWKLLGDLYADAGDHRRALDHYARAQEVNTELGLLEESANASAVQAASYGVLGHPDTALARARHALALHERGGFRRAQLDDHLLIAEFLASGRDAVGAQAHVAAATRLADSLATPVAAATAALGSARVASLLDQPESTLAALDAAAGVLPQLGEAARWEPEALRARACARLGRLAEAEEAGRRAVAAIERHRGAYAPGPLRTSLLSSRAGVYADLVVVLLRQDKQGDAFRVADAARGRALLDQLAAARRDIAQTPRPAAELLELDRLLREIDALTAQLRTLGDVVPTERGAYADDSRRSMVDRLARARREYEARLDRIPAAPEFALLGSTPADPEQVRAALAPGEALLEYFATAEALHLFVVSASGVVHVERATGRAELAAKVRLARDLVSRNERGTRVVRVLGSLYDDLLAPAARRGLLDGAERLVVVPHGPLAYVPFAALLDSAGQPAVRRFAFATLPSASALPALRRTGRAASPAGAQAFVLAPLPDALPATWREASSVRTVIGGRMLLGPAASEPAARAALASARTVHLATHGSMNVENPMFSRLDLAPGTTGSPEDDGRLEIHEVLGLGIAAELVFLSGCETGRGSAWHTDFARTEDYATLAQAFLYAGARNVVATLWRVEDAGAARMAERFYQDANGDAVLALAKAQRASLDDPEFSAPYYWASYIVMGAGGARIARRSE
ncbi:MAG TPA: CHAT domain-containing protein [Gemmatimonadales bacterium]|nr:CHAT domain-containing protein [Gemmatimonadales bacterium]